MNRLHLDFLLYDWVDAPSLTSSRERVHLPPATHEATRAYAETGLLGAGQGKEVGGMQMAWAPPPAMVVMEACGGAHEWGRQLMKMRIMHTNELRRLL